MDERLTARALIAALSLSASSTALGQASLADPTRPPLGATEADPGSAAAPRGGLRLQSVLISNTRRLAVIDGKTVQIGGEVGGATLTAISETGVTLRRGDEVETLRLHPGVEKKKGGPQ
jgi:MSHA biogenesis protein MshK